jgi:hypothetical protein
VLEVALEERSALAFRVSATAHGPVGRARTLILVPAAPGSDTSLMRAVRAAGWGGEVITLLPPRAIYCGELVQGFTWFNAIEPHTIEPTSFEDSLWQLERFVLDLLEEQAQPDELVLIGVGEGAVLVRAATPYLHDRIAAAITVHGHPTFEQLRDHLTERLSTL